MNVSPKSKKSCNSISPKQLQCNNQTSDFSPRNLFESSTTNNTKLSEATAQTTLMFQNTYQSEITNTTNQPEVEVTQQIQIALQTTSPRLNEQRKERTSRLDRKKRASNDKSFNQILNTPTNQQNQLYGRRKSAATQNSYSSSKQLRNIPDLMMPYDSIQLTYYGRISKEQKDEEGIFENKQLSTRFQIYTDVSKDKKASTKKKTKSTKSFTSKQEDTHSNIFKEKKVEKKSHLSQFINAPLEQINQQSFGILTSPESGLFQDDVLIYSQKQQDASQVAVQKQKGDHEIFVDDSIDISTPKKSPNDIIKPAQHQTNLGKKRPLTVFTNSKKNIIAEQEITEEASYQEQESSLDIPKYELVRYLQTQPDSKQLNSKLISPFQKTRNREIVGEVESFHEESPEYQPNSGVIVCGSYLNGNILPESSNPSTVKNVQEQNVLPRGVNSPDFFTSQLITTPDQRKDDFDQDEDDMYEEVACVASNPKDFEFQTVAFSGSEVRVNKQKKSLAEKILSTQVRKPLKSSSKSYIEQPLLCNN